MPNLVRLTRSRRNSLVEEAKDFGKTYFPSQIRVSVGSAVTLGLLTGKLDADPTTIYLMTHKAGKCSANCAFCPQARSSQGKAEMLSRVMWPVFSTELVLTNLKQVINEERIKRVCVQALNYPEVFRGICAFVKKLKQHVAVSVSVSCQPLNSRNMWKLSRSGVDRIGIAFDAATEELFNKVKGTLVDGPYRWKEQFTLLRLAIGIFGEGNVSTHLIIGLGEKENEAAGLIQKCVDLGVLPALFAFTPVEGTRFALKAAPKVDVYRRVQMARYLMANGLVRNTDMSYDEDGRISDFGISKLLLVEILESGRPFLTSGCPDCNRPFYNEKPSGPIYNYPRSLTHKEIDQIRKDLEL